MMDVQLTLQEVIGRAVDLYPDREIVTKQPDGSIHRYTYADAYERMCQLAHAMDELGVDRGERIATVAMNNFRHLELYFAPANSGRSLHMCNMRLPMEHFVHTIEDAGDRVVFVDPAFVEKVEAAAPELDSVEQYVVLGDAVPDTSLEPVVAYEDLIDGQPTEYDWPDLDEDQPAGMCYTSGTTGRPKGVEYTHKMLWSHTMESLSPAGIPMADDDVVMPVVPMFHVNAWGMPFTATAGGAKHVYPGPSPDAEDLAHLIEEEGVTITAGVPTVWLGLMEYAKENDVDLSTLDSAIVGGSAAPRSMIEWFDDHDVELLHAWGMTEMSPIGSVAHLKAGLEDEPYEEQLNRRSKQGLFVPGLEFRVVDDDGEEVPWNGEDFGELYVRGPSVTTEYFERPDANEEDFEDGWLKTGDIVSVDGEGYIKIVDRADDVIKSGGEWISSVELENSIMAHDDVSEAAVVGVPHEKWQERPVAFVVPVEGADEEAVREGVYEMLADEYPKWWLPDEIVFIDEVPKTATGKFSKKDLREEFADASLI